MQDRVNRRQSNRVSYRDSGELTLLEGNKKLSTSVVEIRNLSLGGLAIKSDKHFLRGKLVAITFGNAYERTAVVNGALLHCM